MRFSTSAITIRSITSRRCMRPTRTSNRPQSGVAAPTRAQHLRLQLQERLIVFVINDRKRLASSSTLHHVTRKIVTALAAHAVLFCASIFQGMCKLAQHVMAHNHCSPSPSLIRLCAGKARQSRVNPKQSMRRRILPGRRRAHLNL